MTVIEIRCCNFDIYQVFDIKRTHIFCVFARLDIHLASREDNTEVP